MTSDTLRCAIYTRKSSEEGLEQSFNSLHAQREACEAFIRSQAGEGWRRGRVRYEDGGYSGGTTNRPALRRLLLDVESRLIDVVVVYKVDRLTRSLADFAKIIEAFDRAGVTFVSITQALNTTTSMGRLTLNVLLSFAQFEREVTGERIRDKIAASKAKGMWMGGTPPLGYDPPISQVTRALVVNDAEAVSVRQIFLRFLQLTNLGALQKALLVDGIRSKRWCTRKGRLVGGYNFSRGALRSLLKNRIYLGEIVHKGERHAGRHQAIVDQPTFGAVQQLLAHRSERRRSHVPKSAAALLHGILFDGDGRPMEPITTAAARGRTYRYYVSPTRWPGTAAGAEDDAIRRVPADAIENLVGRRLACLAGLPVAEIDKETVRSLLARVEVHSSSVRLVIRLQGVRAWAEGRSAIEVLRRNLQPGDQLTADPQDTRLIHVVLPVRLKVRGGRSWVVGVDGTHLGRATKPDGALIKRIRNAHQILRTCGATPDGPMSQLRYAKAPKGSQMAQARWAFLAPDIQSAVMEGAVGQGAASISSPGTIPLLWSEQRLLFGMQPENS